MDKQIERARNGDQEAFISLILDKKEQLYKIARARLKKEDEIEDAIQETIILAYYKLPKLKENDKFYIWLTKILVNKCKEVYRKKRIVEISFDEKIEKVENTFEAKSDNKILYEKMMNFLSYEERLIILFYYNLGYTTKEIASVLDKNENTIKSKLKRSKEKLKKEFGGGDED